MSEALLEVHNLTIDLPPGAERDHAVAGVSFVLNKSEILCLAGESGSGKSVVARSILGLLAPNLNVKSGRIIYGGRDILKIPPEERRRIRGRHISMIFQDPLTALNPLKTIGNLVNEVFQVHGDVSTYSRASRVNELFEAVGLPDPIQIQRSYPHQLSGGQRQRVMISMALALKPEVLIADEPTTALDVTTQAQILGLIKKIQSERHMGVLFITHDFGVVSEIADKVMIMHRGNLVESGPVDLILQAPQQPYTQSLIGSIPKLEPSRSRANELSTRNIIVTAEKLTKSFRPKALLRSRKITRAVKNVTLSISRGETLGLVGESGSGKSTLARCIVGLIYPDSGTVLVNGDNLGLMSRSKRRRFKKNIQMIFQDPYSSLDPRQTVENIIAEGPIVHGVPKAEAVAIAKKLLTLVGLDPRAGDRYPHEFSGGQRQRIGIARALALEPEVIVADEALSALDVTIQAQILSLLKDIRNRFKLSMLFVTHDLRVAAQICDNIAVMRNGEILEYGPVQEVFQKPRHQYTHELLAAIPGKNLGLRKNI